MKAIYPLVAMAVLAMWLPAGAATEQPGESRISEIAVDLQFSGDFVGQETRRRLEFALLDTLELALIGQLDGDLDYILQEQQSVANTIGQVISESLHKRGFVLEELVLDPGELTRVTIRLHLADQQVSDFSVKFHILGNSPIVEAAITEDVAGVRAALNGRLASTPYSDTRWISALVTEVVDGYFSGREAYGGFDRVVTVQAGATTVVAVAFEPSEQAELLDCYSLKFRSLTLPMIKLARARQSAESYLGSLIGAPTSFILARQNLIRQALYRHLVAECAVVETESDLHIRAGLHDCCLEMLVDAESASLFAAGQARLDLWDHDAPDYAGRLSGRLGFQPVTGWPVYGHVDYFPAAAEAFPLVGAGHLFDGDVFAGAGWDFNARSWRFQGLGNLTPDVYLRADIFASDSWDDLSELSVHYRLKDVYELQLVSSFGGEVFAAVAANL